MIWIQNQLVGSMEGEQITLECHSEAFPKSINYWTKNEGHIISQGTYARSFQREYFSVIKPFAKASRESGKLNPGSTNCISRFANFAESDRTEH